MKKLEPTFFPFYCITSPLVRAALGVKDLRSVRRRFEKAKIPLIKIGDMECVTCESLLEACTPKPTVNDRPIVKKTGIKEFDELL